MKIKFYEGVRASKKKKKLHMLKYYKCWLGFTIKLVIKGGEENIDRL